MTLNNDKQKINDKLGNPIIIGIVVIWRVANTAKADASSVLERLGRLEDLYDALTAERNKIAARMEEVRGRGKVKTAAYRQNMAHKLMLQGLMDRIDIYAGEAPGAKK